MNADRCRRNPLTVAGSRLRRRLSLLALALSLGGTVVAADVLDREVQLDIARQPLSKALLEFSRQTHVQVMMSGSAGDPLTTVDLKGTYRARAAMEALLKESGFSFKERGNTVTISPSQAATSDPGAGSGQDGSQSDSTVRDDSGKHAERAADLEEIVVTGSHIRGVGAAGSPVLVVGSKDIEESGVGTIDAFTSLLPQAFADVSPGTQDFSTNVKAIYNTGFGAGMDLRGLGAGTTLVLLNGHRMAPGADEGSFVDISMIPASVVDHIDLLLDGASAVYGSDAVGGVANFVLKNEFDGVETSARYGSDSKGVSEERAGVTTGTRWNGGGGILSYEYYSRNALASGDRSISSGIGDPGVDLVPAQSANSFWGSAKQSLGDRLELTGFTLFSDRLARDNDYVADGSLTTANHSRSWNQTSNTNLDLEYTTLSDWKFALAATYGQTALTAEVPAILFYPAYLIKSDQSFESLEATADGKLIDLPAGALRIAAGSSYRHESSDQSSFITAVPATIQNASRDVRSLFLEASLPLLGPDQVPAVHELTVSLAGRIDDYSDFGSATVPKLGVSYRPVTALGFRGSFGRSFRAPLLQDLFEQKELALFDAPDPASRSGKTLTLFNVGAGNAGLKPERARNWTVGADLEPTDVPVKLSVTYYDVSFTKMIANPAFSILDFFTNPAIYGSLIVRNPGAAFVSSAIANTGRFINEYGPFDPSAVGAYVDDRLQNLAVESTNGIDLTASSRLAAGGGVLDLALNSTYILKFVQGVTPEAPLASFLNTVGYPIGLRSRGTVSWSRGGFGATAGVNYSRHYLNPLVTPSLPVSSWTTADLQVRYDTGNRPLSPGLAHLRVALSANNLFNVTPPYVPGVYRNIGYDAANANPMGRFLSVTLTKDW